MAEDKERFRRALDFMKMLGVSHAVVTPLLRRLIKLYDNEWSLIEEENYRTLADSYFDQVESKEAKVPLRVTRNSSRHCTSSEIRATEEHAKEDNLVCTKANRRVTFSPISPTVDNGSLDHMEDRERPSHVEVNPLEAVVPKKDRCAHELQLECVRYQETSNDLAHTERGRFKKPRIEVSAPPPVVRKLVPDIVLASPLPKIPSKVKEEPLELPPVMERRDGIVTKHVGPQPQTVPAAIMSTRQQGREIVVFNKDDQRKSRIDELESKEDSLSREKTRKISALIAYSNKKAATQENDSLLRIAAMYGHTSDDECAFGRNASIQQTCKPLCRQETCANAEGKSPTCMPPYTKETCANAKGKSPTSSNALILRGKETSVTCLGSAITVKEEPAGASVSVAHHNTYAHNHDDISRGQESIPITVLNTVTNEKLPPSFYYIKNNIIFQDAYVNFALARIGEEDCCARCSDNCLNRYPPCHCARESGGEFAYDPEGRLRSLLLHEAITDKRDAESSSTRNKYCEKGSCFLARGKNGENSEQCKGHLIRKFVKECWSKCGCDMRCGNRVVQKGICRKLQVFYISRGKGWGLRTLEDLLPGTFVCEYVGEILTNVELDIRNTARKGHTDHYPTLLDSDLSSETMLKDEELLCLDATTYGNVARFINHRCHDANLVDIPVEIESPDHHYYHIAFFTTRPVKAFEELTWDYCIDFEDTTHPIKAFKCLCESHYCRGRHYKA